MQKNNRKERKEKKGGRITSKGNRLGRGDYCPPAVSKSIIFRDNDDNFTPSEGNFIISSPGKV